MKPGSRTNISDIILYSSRIFLAVREVIPVISELSKGISLIGNLRSAIDLCRKHYHGKTARMLNDEVIESKLSDARMQAVAVLLEKAIEKSVDDLWSDVKEIKIDILVKYIREHLNMDCRFTRGNRMEIVRVKTGEDEKYGKDLERLCATINDNFSQMFSTITAENASTVIEIEDLRRVDEEISLMIESLSKRLDSLYSPLRSELPSLPERCIYRYSVLSEVEDLFCSGVRLCFLQGEGGSGKTTLARQVCDYLAGRYSVSWITVDNNSFAGEKKAWYHSSVGREFSIVFGRLAFPTFSQFGRGGISDFEIRDAFSSYMNKGPSLVVFDMNTVPFTRNDYDFLFTTQGKLRPFPPSWRFLVLVRNTPEHIGEGVVIDFDKRDGSLSHFRSARMSRDEIYEQLASEIRYFNPEYSYFDYMLSDLADYADGNPLLASHMANEINYYSQQTVQPITTLKKRLFSPSGWNTDDVFDKLMSILDFTRGDSRWGDDITDYLKLCILLPTEPLAHPHLIFGRSGHAKERMRILISSGVLRETKAGIICHDQVKNAISNYFFGTFIISSDPKKKRLGLENMELMNFLISLSSPGRFEKESILERLSGEITALEGADPEIRRHKIEPLIINMFMLSGLLGNSIYFDLFSHNGQVMHEPFKGDILPLLALFGKAVYILKGGLLSKDVILNVSSFISLLLKDVPSSASSQILDEQSSFMIALSRGDTYERGSELKKKALSSALKRINTDPRAALDACTYATSYLYSRANSAINGYDDFMMKFYAYLAISESEDLPVCAKGESEEIYGIYRKIGKAFGKLQERRVPILKSRILDNFAGGLGAYGFFHLQKDLKEQNYELLKSGFPSEVAEAVEVIEQSYSQNPDDVDRKPALKICKMLDYDSRDALAFRLNNLGYSILDLEYWDCGPSSENLKAEGCLLSSRLIFKGIISNNSCINLKTLFIYYLRNALFEKDESRRRDYLADANSYFFSFLDAYSRYAGIRRDWVETDIDTDDDIALEARSLFLQKRFLEKGISEEELIFATRAWCSKVKKGAAIFRHLRFLELCGIDVEEKFSISPSIESYYLLHVDIPFKKDFIRECSQNSLTSKWCLDSESYRNGLVRIHSKYVKS